ncbi:MAG: hypothetical protein JWM90_178 [Thermoleophilia bacterium]|nr:hypothetical protein [Thermoleophilia bacterium]
MIDVRHRIAAAATLLATAITLTCASSAPAAYVDDVAQAWEDDPVYVDPDERAALSASEERELEQQIGEGDESVYVAILPEEARSEGGGTTVGVLRELAQEQGSNATYAAIIGGQFRAGSTDNINAADLAEDAFNDNRSDGVPAVLDAFVTSVQQAEAGGGSSGGSSGSDGGGPGFLGLLFPLLFIVGGILLVTRIRRQRTAVSRAASEPAHIDDMEVDELQEVNRAARGDLVALGEALRTMDIEIQLPDAPGPAKQRYVAALDAYQKVSAVIDEADTLPELRPVSRDIARGRYALDCARALLDGKPEPEPRVACFFDPRHGTSVRDVQWIGPKNESLQVPACEICADRVEAGRQPDTRQVEIHGRKMPYYEEPQMGGYYGGFFGGGGGGGSLISGLLLGNLLGGGGLFGGSGWSSGGGGDSGWGGGDWGGGGDFGGDFGGGGDF